MHLLQVKRLGDESFVYTSGPMCAKRGTDQDGKLYDFHLGFLQCYMEVQLNLAPEFHVQLYK